MSTTGTAVACVPLTGTIGAEVVGIDLANVTEADRDAVHSALCDHKVLFFRDQHLDDRAQCAFARMFGPVQQFPFGRPVDPAIPEVHAIATGGGAPKVGNADIWHSDATFQAAPPLGSVLRAVELPSRGGDTLFANMEAAYESLSSPVQRLVNELTATHSFTHSASHRSDLGDRYPPVCHPVVRVHPVTGRGRCTSIASSPYGSTNWQIKRTKHCWPCCVTTYGHPNSSAGSPGDWDRLRSGTTGARSTMPWGLHRTSSHASGGHRRRCSVGC